MKRVDRVETVFDDSSIAVASVASQCPSLYGTIMFERVDDSRFIKGEHEVLRWWRGRGIFAKLLAKNAGGPKWSFLDGPITANNPMGVHHGWGRTYKDLFVRFWTMQGRELRYQNGFDCQGLWVEVEVER